VRTRPAICRRKMRYEDEKSALQAAEQTPFPLRPYRCELCDRYHLTGRTKGMRVPPFERARRAALKAS